MQDADPIKDARKIINSQIFGNEVVDTLRKFYDLAARCHGSISFATSQDGKICYCVRIGNDSNHVQRVQYDPGNFPAFLVSLNGILKWMEKVAGTAEKLDTEWNKTE